MFNKFISSGHYSDYPVDYQYYYDEYPVNPCDYSDRAGDFFSPPDYPADYSTGCLKNTTLGFV